MPGVVSVATAQAAPKAVFQGGCGGAAHIETNNDSPRTHHSPTAAAARGLVVTATAQHLPLLLLLLLLLVACSLSSLAACLGDRVGVASLSRRRVTG
jgi:hypothetical protein